MLLQDLRVSELAGELDLLFILLISVEDASCETCSTGSFHHTDSSLAIFEGKAAAGCNFASMILSGLDRSGVARSSITNISNQHYNVGRVKLNTLGPTSMQYLEFYTLRGKLRAATSADTC
jgi:hypothetical protein